MLRAAKSRDGVTLEIAAGVPYARVAQLQSIEVTLPIGRDAPAAGVSVVVGNVKLKGLATPPGLALYPARPFVIGEVMAPARTAVCAGAMSSPIASRWRSSWRRRAGRRSRDLKGPARVAPVRRSSA